VPSGDATHAAVIDSSNRFVFVPAKLSDWIAQYSFDETTGALTAATPASVATVTGSGPRHLVFHPSGRFAYVNNETDRTVNAYSFDATLGTLDAIQAPQNAVAGSGEEWTTSEIAMHPSGKFLYVSNRLEAASTLTLFAIDPVSGHLARVTEFPSQGSTPRSIALDHAGSVLIVGNQDSQNIALFRVDPDTGELSLLDTLALAVDPVFIGVFSVPL
jgi:6-phosphogluconolactonase